MSNLNDLTKEELITYIQPIYEKLHGIESIIGDIPVSEQISTALNGVANEQNVRELANELSALKVKVETLIGLVGDTPVAEQINRAISNEN